jgi:peptidyl-prolyl cis-trans isomerase A (cyclophilin A)
MKISCLIIVLLVGTLISASGEDRDQLVLIKTELGNIEVEIFQDKAPVSAGNFLKYVDQGIYKNSSFYRTVTLNNQPDNDVKIEVIQGGLFDKSEKYLPIKHETTKETGILHKDGTISYARNEPGTANTEFFICVGDQPELDYGGRRNPDRQGFAAFGRVIKGMDVVRKIHIKPADGQMLKPRIKIYNIERIKQG